MSIDFDKYFFRLLDYIRIWLKRLFTRLCLRDIQSCKYCGRDQWVIWTVKDNLWYLIPKKYHNKTLCLECFVRLCPRGLIMKDFEVIYFPMKKEVLNENTKSN